MVRRGKKSVRNVDIPSEIKTSTRGVGGRISHPSPRSTILFGICLWKLRDGIKIAIAFRQWEIVKYIWKYPVTFTKAPEMADPSMLAEKGTGKLIEPEDMNRPVEFDKPIEPGDM